MEAEIFRDVREGCDKVHDKYNNWWSYKLRYLVHCHMCTGIWVSAIVALFIPAFVSGGFFGWALTALAIKGIAHSFLVLQKLGEEITNSHKTKAAADEYDLAEREEWKARVRANDADSPSVNLF